MLIIELNQKPRPEEDFTRAITVNADTMETWVRMSDGSTRITFTSGVSTLVADAVVDINESIRRAWDRTH